MIRIGSDLSSVMPIAWAIFAMLAVCAIVFLVVWIKSSKAAANSRAVLRTVADRLLVEEIEQKEMLKSINEKIASLEKILKEVE